MFTMMRVRQSSLLLKYPGRNETSNQKTTVTRAVGLQVVIWLNFCSNRANICVQAGFEGPWLAESACESWTNSRTVHLSTFLSQ